MMPARSRRLSLALGVAAALAAVWSLAPLAAQNGGGVGAGVDELDIPEGLSLVGWFGAPTDSAAILENHPGLEQNLVVRSGDRRVAAGRFRLALHPPHADQGETRHRPARARRLPHDAAGAAGGERVAGLPADLSPVDPSDPSIIVDTPSDDATVTSPVRVEGLARTLEANVRITIFGQGGSVVADTFTTAAEGAPALSPFATDVSFTVTREQPGCLRVFETSASDGSPRNVVQIPVTLTP